MLNYYSLNIDCDSLSNIKTCIFFITICNFKVNSKKCLLVVQQFAYFWRYITMSKRTVVAAPYQLPQRH